ncbi:MAG: hypothetical protein CMF74_00935 [Maricaulis sp.]|nr:hypothetical protein [Maricaulis sp.]HAQ36709.1 hypothetical protein [Alphaproteobacteria bacterium]
MRVVLFISGLAGLAASLAGPAAAQTDYEAADRARYQACLERIGTDPENAYEDALAWRYESGGWPARHCEARALIALGEAGEGAARLEAVASAPDTSDQWVKVLLFAEAGEAWMTAGQPEDSRRAYTEALEYNNESAPLWLGRARGAAEQAMWAAAEADASAAIRQDSTLGEAYTIRAQARLELGDLDGAQRDMEQARQIDPADIDALLVRGRINEARRTGG